MQFTIATIAAILAFANGAPGTISARDLNAPGYDKQLPGAKVPYSCTKQSPCGTPKDKNAHATYYKLEAPGTGHPTACGYNDPQNQYTDAKITDQKDDFIALGAGVMGSLSSGEKMNPVCGKKITVKNEKSGKTMTAPVVDKCPDCDSNYALDMSEHLFHAMGGTKEDGTFPISWYWA